MTFRGLAPRQLLRNGFAPLVWTGILLLSLTSPFELIERKGFDWLTILDAPDAIDSPIAIVGIDEASFAELQRQWPWPRGWHARLIDALNEAGAVVIGIDVVFADPSEAQEDRALAAAIQRAGNVVLVADELPLDSEHASGWMRIEPIPGLLEAGAISGVATISLDGDGVLRRVPSGEDRFWVRVLQQFAASKHERSGEAGHMIRYRGPAHSFPYLSYYEAIDPERFGVADRMKGRIVLVGRDLKASPTPDARRADMFETPFTTIAGTLTPGVEIQANMIMNGLAGNSIRLLATPWWLLLFVATAAVSVSLLRTWQPVRSALIALTLILALLAGAWALFHYQNLWLPVFALVAGVALNYLAEGGLAFFREQAQRRQIKRAFSYYVAPQVVEEMIAHPDRLVLGGERRELTMMFTDLAGFTTLSESMPAERISELLNWHLTDMTDIILQHQGTVDKFVGDAIAAFWGAPLADPEHAVRACRAAYLMQQGMARMREQLRDAGEPEMHMRVGIHTGPVVVGNMGSRDRFDYSIIGDNANLAARLEGINKVYGTHTLISEATVKLLDGELPLRWVDRVCPKGKTEAIEIYTLSDAGDPSALNDRAIRAYRERRWQQATALWRELLSQQPDDTIARVYIERIALYGEQPPPADWDGSFILEHK